VADFRGKRVLVTGGAGFIGGHLVASLAKGGAARVAVVDNLFLGREENLADTKEAFGDVLRFHREDAADAGAMKAIFAKEKPEIVFNLATKALLYSFFNPSGAAKVNFDIALILAELLHEGQYEKLVHLSSSEVYGTAQFVPMTEQHPLLAETSYAAGKAAADLLLASYVNMFKLDIVTVRPFNNYGPRQNDRALAAIVPLTVRRIERGETPVLEGDGLQTRDFIFVEDTVVAILKLAQLPGLSGRTINLGSGRETTMKEIVQTIADIMSYRGELRYTAARVADVRRHCAGIDQVRSLIGEPSQTALSDGLRRTVEWYGATQP
jgi:UDP-glucose 4-epimerase